MFIVVEVAHWPDAGVKVYVLVPRTEVLMVAGFQVPVMVGELVEAEGKTGGDELRHKGPIGVKTGFA